MTETILTVFLETRCSVLHK